MASSTRSGVTSPSPASKRAQMAFAEAVETCCPMTIFTSPAKPPGCARQVNDGVRASTTARAESIAANSRRAAAMVSVEGKRSGGDMCRFDRLGGRLSTAALPERAQSFSSSR